MPHLQRACSQHARRPVGIRAVHVVALQHVLGWHNMIRDEGAHAAYQIRDPRRWLKAGGPWLPVNDTVCSAASRADSMLLTGLCRKVFVSVSGTAAPRSELTFYEQVCAMVASSRSRLNLHKEYALMLWELTEGWTHFNEAGAASSSLSRLCCRCDCGSSPVCSADPANGAGGSPNAKESSACCATISSARTARLDTTLTAPTCAAFQLHSGPLNWLRRC